MLKFIKEWMLPIAIILGVVSYLILYYVPPFAVHIEPGFSVFAKKVQPMLIATMLFLQFNKISPHDFRLRKWHIAALCFQLFMFIALTWIAAILPDGSAKILAESAMLCFICPTAAAAGVITSKLGGSLSDTVSYVMLINVAVSIAIPLIIPIFNTSADVSFISSFIAISMRIFPILVLPLLLAWLIRYTMKKLQHKLLRFVDWAFYFWGLSLGFSVYLATKSLVDSHISFWTVVLIGVISLLCTLIQFAVGRGVGALSKSNSPEETKADVITAGQALGQKNSGFLIWLGCSYLTPVTSVAGGLYSIWQNIINSLELYHKNHE